MIGEERDPMSAAPFPESVRGTSVVGLTLDQYVRMIDAGILMSGEPIELLDGFLVRKDRSKAGEDPMTIGFEHVWAVQMIGRILEPLAQPHGHYVRLQSPIAIPPDSAPEPDGAIARGTPDDYRDRYPSAADVPCVIEVADSSLHHDRVTKKRIYAKAGIGQYVIINLIGRVIEVWDGPVAGADRYANERVLRPGEVVRFSVGGAATIDVEVARLLPATTPVL
jgi:Uma2 family endonuclease